MENELGNGVEIVVAGVTHNLGDALHDVDDVGFRESQDLIGVGGELLLPVVFLCVDS